MQTQHIRHNHDNSALIVYFAGWGTSPELVRHWQLPSDTDVLLCWDYRNLTLDFDFTRYQSLYLVAWSMGVWAAEQCVADLSFVRAVAINGTPLLIHDDLAIVQAVFEGTLHGFDEQTRTKFERRMCGNRELLHAYQASPLRPTAQIHQELMAVYQAMPQAKRPSIAWQKAIIGRQDKIFPSANQLEFWRQTGCQIVQLDVPHFALMAFDDWSDVLC
ncbi:MAG: DUF452 family protein [Moraxella sp.]|nr:DUF452 family protein [Moraxella sp.]